MGYDDDTKPLIIEMINGIKEKMGQDDPYATLIDTDILVKTLDAEWLKENKFEKLQGEIDNFLKNPSNSRVVRLNSRIKNDLEASVEYYDSDKSKNKRLHYQPNMEKDLLILFENIRSLLAKIITTKFGDSFKLD